MFKEGRLSDLAIISVSLIYDASAYQRCLTSGGQTFASISELAYRSKFNFKLKSKERCRIQLCN